MSKKFTRMSEASVKAIIADLNKFARGELGGKVTWSVLEDRHGFSRQSLQARPEIKAAYANAKHFLSGELLRSKQNTSKDIERSEEHTSELQSLMRISYAV